MKQSIKKVSRHHISIFAYIGLVNTLIDIILLNCLRIITNTPTTNKKQIILLNIISASIVACFSFFMNRRFVFKAKDHAKNNRIIPFLIVTLFSIFVIQTTVITISLHHISGVSRFFMNIVQGAHLPVVNSATINFYDTTISKLLATTASMIWNYLFYSKFIFKKKYQDL